MSPKNLEDYIQALQLPEVGAAKIRRVLAFYNENQLIQAQDIFVSQEKDADGNIRPNRLWMLNENFCAEADISNGKIAGDVASIKGRVRRYEITASDDDFNDPDTAKYLNIFALVAGGLACKFAAYGKNRQVLWDAFSRNIKPNVIGN